MLECDIMVNKEEKIEPIIEKILKKYNDDVKRHISGVRIEFEESVKRHIDVVKEEFHGQVKMIAEQYTGITERLDSHTEMIGSMAEDVEVIKSDIEFIKGSLKKKVDYDEFIALERRLTLVEAKMRR